MTKRFILIESNTGYVWGEAMADSIVDACRSVDEGNGEDRVYDEWPHVPRDTHGFYTVYDATGSNIVVDNGQDEALIAAVSALPIAGYGVSERILPF